jgi:hypothetical protein
MEDNSVETVLGFGREKGVETCGLNQNYIITTSWSYGTSFFWVKTCNSSLIRLV